MDKIKGYYVHTLALNLVRGPNYMATVKRETDQEGINEIVIRIPFPADFNEEIMARLIEEIATGIYLPRSGATKGLIERGESDGSTD